MSYTPKFQELLNAQPRIDENGRAIATSTRINMALYSGNEKKINNHVLELREDFFESLGSQRRRARMLGVATEGRER